MCGAGTPEPRQPLPELKMHATHAGTLHAMSLKGRNVVERADSVFIGFLVVLAVAVAIGVFAIPY